ncbi:hypothetical protein XELAEV_18019789mg [Xenopus laevis]|uniref:CCHC-type domain-containing protein n=1 Tax=Xenopus laevis TaxID=8355 RepID=A0A974D7J0_XENLA|nr:hypothetical protein XELAEV_18019789mg [Xenopus laevis]
MASSAESPQSVLEWCKSLGLDPKKTAVVGPMMLRTKEEVIYKILDADGSIYRPRVVGSRQDPSGVWLNVLVDSPYEINRETCAHGVEAEEDCYWQIVLPYVPEEKNRSSEKTSSDSLTEQEITVLKKEIAKFRARVSGRDEMPTMSRPAPFPKVSGAGREPPKCFICGQLGHISTNCNKQSEEVVAAEVTSSGCDVKKLPKKRYRKRRSQVKCYNCGRYGHTASSCDWGLNEESYDGYVTSFPCEVNIPEEKSCGTRMVSEHSGTPNKHERLGWGKRKPSGRGNVKVVSETVFPCDSTPEVRENKKGQEGQARTLPIQAGGECRELVQTPCSYPCKGRSTENVSECCKPLPSNQLFSAAGSDTAASEWLAGKGRSRYWRKKMGWYREPHDGQRKRPESSWWAERAERLHHKHSFGSDWHREAPYCAWEDRECEMNPDWRNNQQ